MSKDKKDAMLNLSEKFQRIEMLSIDGYDLKITTYISDAFEIFGRNAGGFILFTLFQFIFSFLCRQLLPPLGSILFGIFITPALSVGPMIVARKIRYDEPYSFNDFFLGFNKYGPLVLVNLCVLIFFLLGFLCLIIPGIYLAVAYVFVQPLVWFLYDGSVMDTLERSRKLVSKNWFSFFGFFLVILLLNLGGVLCIGIGLLVTIPVSAIALYLCFEDLIGTEEEEEVHTTESIA
jgi:hypothetical protein